ncbi:NRDE family protein [Microbacterium sp. No. 7]|uniref:NRDE family protein n=1 Tax=Microbacterium sp. No. 7 TaxID=1714373 RepID=UPI0006D11FDC|nr:NRDE family protein [Microbacterium sp. No. 7]ALJ21583.1 hypothetical protein AOA12_17460 [Microbacterium sp. No. 7]
MCTAIIHVPPAPGQPIRLLAVRDEDPARTWHPLGAWWPDTHPGVVGVRDGLAGGAWLAASDARRRVAVILNRAPVDLPPGPEPVSRGHIALAAAEGRGVETAPRANGFNLVEATAEGVRVTMWDGGGLRRVQLDPGIHMIAHDDVDDPGTARITAWHDAFADPGEGPRWWERWLDVLEDTTRVGPLDDRAVVRDNRPHGYPTLSLLVCAATVSSEGAEVVYGEFDEPGVWNRVTMRPPLVP